MWLLLPFVLLPIVEITLFIQVGGVIGVLPTIALVLLSALAGMAVMRRQGAVAMLDVQRAMQEFRSPAAPMAQGGLVMLGGALMILPGLFTSAVGLLLLIPAVRGLILGWMGRRVRVGSMGFGYRAPSGADFPGDFPQGYPRGQGEGVIDGEYSVQDDPPAPVREGLTDDTGRTGPARRGPSGWTRH